MRTRRSPPKMIEETNDNGTTRSVKIVTPVEEEEKKSSVVGYHSPIWKESEVNISKDFMEYITKQAAVTFGIPKEKFVTLDSLDSLPGVKTEEKKESKPNHEPLTRAELRCGNWIRFPEEVESEGVVTKWYPDPHLVKEMDCEYCYVHHIDNRDDEGDCKYKELSGFAINDDIMLSKFGFTKDGRDYVLKDSVGTLKFVTDGSRKVGDDRLTLYRPQVNGNFFSIKRVAYIHEVQNLFYAVFDIDIITQIKYGDDD